MNVFFTPKTKPSMRDFLENNKTWFFAAIVFLATLPLSCHGSKAEETIIHYLLLRDNPVLGFLLAGNACLLALFSWSAFSKRQQIGLGVLFFLLPFACISQGNLPLIWMVWSFQPLIGGMYWILLLLLLLKPKRG